MDASNGNERPPRKIIDLQGGKKDILFSVAVVVVPMVILTALLLGLIIQNQVPQTYSALPGVPDPLARESSALLVDFSATRLLTVASWTSTVSSLLPSFIMVLVSYPIARTILNASREKNTDELPTPYQLSMLLDVLSGSIGSLWNWFKYRGWKKRERFNGVAKGCITCLVFVSVLGYLIVIADTWLHATTSTIQLLQALPGPSSVSTFGRGFYSSECVNNTYPCSVSTGNHGTGLTNGAEGFQTLANTSSQNLMLTFLYEDQSYALITDANIPQNTDYQAQTFAVTTQCTLISEECGLSLGPVGSSPFNCSGEFSGYLPNYKYFISASSNPSWGLAGVEFFQDSRLTQNFSTVEGANMAGGPFTPANPVYIGAYGLVLGFNGGSSTLLNSSEFLQTETQGLGFIMGCKLMVYDLEYVWYDGSVLVQQMVLSNTTVASVLTAPFVTELANLVTLAQSAAGKDTPSAFVESWTTGFSTMVLGLSAGIMSPRATIMEQARALTLVARVPKAPLVILVFLTLLYAAVGIVLAVIAAQAGAGETKNVHGRLSVAGLAAKCFESEDRCEGPAKEIHDLFAENEVGARDHRCSKVSIVASYRGGWKYDVIEKDERQIL